MRWLLIGAGVGLAWLAAGLLVGLIAGPILSHTHKRPAPGKRPTPGPDAAASPPAPPRAPAPDPLPGPPRLVSHERLPGGYTRNLCACRCWSLADDRSRVIFRYVCGTCTRADLDQFLEETLTDPP